MELYVVAALLMFLGAIVAILNCGARRARTQYDGQTDNRRLIIQELFQEGVGGRYAAMALNRAGFRNREGNEFTEEQVKIEHSKTFVAVANSSPRLKSSKAGARLKNVAAEHNGRL